MGENLSSERFPPINPVILPYGYHAYDGGDFAVKLFRNVAGVFIEVKSSKKLAKSEIKCYHINVCANLYERKILCKS